MIARHRNALGTGLQVQERAPCESSVLVLVLVLAMQARLCTSTSSAKIILLPAILVISTSRCASVSSGWLFERKKTLKNKNKPKRKISGN